MDTNVLFRGENNCRVCRRRFPARRGLRHVILLPMKGDCFTIVHVTAPQETTSGDFVYRVKQPDAALGGIPGVATASITIICREAHRLALDADLLVLQLLGDADMLPVVLDRRRRGLPTVFEISDNFLDFQPDNPSARFYEQPESRACILQLISECDAAQATVPAIAEKFSLFNEDIRVFENCITTPGKTVKGDGPLVVGWGGSMGHYEDVRKVAPALCEWVNGREDVVFSLMAAEEFRELFSAMDRKKFRCRATGSLADYFDFLETLHVGIAPLEDHPFNLCRSDVKFIEYASRGAVPVCSDVGTYSRTLEDGVNGFLFDTPARMVELLDTLADDRGLMRDMAARAYDYIAEERAPEKDAAARLDFYKSLFSSDFPGGTLTLDKLNSLPSLVKTGGSKHFLHEMTDEEKFVYSGMVYEETRGDAARAEDCYARAISIAPEYFHAQFMMGRMKCGSAPRDAGRLLARALEIRPMSCEARFYLAYAAAGDEKKALSVLRDALEMCPGYAPAYRAQAEIHLKNSRRGEAREALAGALDANRFYSPAYLLLGAMAMEDGKHGEAERFFRQALDHTPRYMEARLGLAAALLETKGCLDAAEQYILAVENGAGPEAREGIFGVCKELYKQRDYDNCREFIRRVVDVFQGDAELLFWLWRACERLGDDEGAERTATELREADTEGRYSRYL